MNEWVLEWKGRERSLREIGCKLMDNFPIGVRQQHFSEAICDKETQKKDCSTPETPKRAQNRRMCNELVHELCLQIPTASTSSRILLTSFNIHTYLTPRFRKMVKLIYGDVMAFLVESLNTKSPPRISIAMAQHYNDRREGVVVLNQRQAYKNLALETNHFRVELNSSYDRHSSTNSRNVICWISGSSAQMESVQLHCFLRLIAPLVRPIQLCFASHTKPVEKALRFLNAQSGDCVDSIRLDAGHFESAAVCGALSKHNELRIYGSLSAANVPKLIRWLTGGEGHLKKCTIFPLNDAMTQLLDQIKRDFVRANRKCRFVVRLVLCVLLDEFSLCNEWTGEELRLRRTNVNNGNLFYTLSRFPTNGFATNEEKCAELSPIGMTRIYLD